MPNLRQFVLSRREFLNTTCSFHEGRNNLLTEMHLILSPRGSLKARLIIRLAAEMFEFRNGRLFFWHTQAVHPSQRNMAIAHKALRLRSLTNLLLKRTTLSHIH